MRIIITEDYTVDYANLDARIIEVSENAKALETAKAAADEQIQAICDGIYAEICEKVYPIADRYKNLCANTGWHRDFKTTDFKIGSNGSVKIFVFSDYASDWCDITSGGVFYNGKTGGSFKIFVKSFNKENYLRELVKAFERETNIINEDINEKRLKKQEELNKFLSL